MKKMIYILCFVLPLVLIGQQTFTQAYSPKNSKKELRDNIAKAEYPNSAGRYVTAVLNADKKSPYPKTAEYNYNLTKTTEVLPDSIHPYITHGNWPDDAEVRHIGMKAEDMAVIQAYLPNGPWWYTSFWDNNQPPNTLNAWKAAFEHLDNTTRLSYIPDYNLLTNGIFSDGEIVIMENYDDPNDTGLPVELMSFSGQQYEDVVKLNWSTASDLNNAKYIIERERKDDGKNRRGKWAGKFKRWIRLSVYRQSS